MKATVQKLNMATKHCEATTSNGIIFSFKIDKNYAIDIGDMIEVDLEDLDKNQIAHNISKNRKFNITIKWEDVHDADKPIEHSTSRFPSIEKIKGA
jgi:hypothetical protein